MNKKKTVWYRIKRRIREKVLTPLIRRLGGIDELEENLYYFLNSATDITKCKPAEGNLRLLQLADTELLKLFHHFCAINNLTYWIDYGTLLGATRHKGFIPWDDDIDVAMPREDFVRAVELSQEFFTQSKFWVSTMEEALHFRLFIGHKGGLNLDVFPMDSMPFQDEDTFRRNLIAYSSYIKTNGTFSNEADRAQFQHKVCGNIDSSRIVYYHAPECESAIKHYEPEDIFPPLLIPFEDTELYAPHNYHMYLTACYGDYMKYPKTGLLHHKGLEASMNKSDLNAILEKMRSINRTVLQTEERSCIPAEGK